MFSNHIVTIEQDITFGQIPPFISTIPRTVITYQLNLYIRTDGLRSVSYTHLFFLNWWLLSIDASSGVCAILYTTTLVGGFFCLLASGLDVYKRQAINKIIVLFFMPYLLSLVSKYGLSSSRVNLSLIHIFSVPSVWHLSYGKRG